MAKERYPAVYLSLYLGYGTKGQKALETLKARAKEAGISVSEYIKRVLGL